MNLLLANIAVRLKPCRGGPDRCSAFMAVMVLSVLEMKFNGQVLRKRKYDNEIRGELSTKQHRTIPNPVRRVLLVAHEYFSSEPSPESNVVPLISHRLSTNA